MKRIYTVIVAALLSMFAAGTAEAQDWGRLLQAGAKTVQSMTISDAQVQGYVRQYINNLDAKSQVAPADNPYTIRLNRIVKGVTQVDGIPLNFKVYITQDVNAFACADGSVRVYSGLMDLMNDQEVLGVIGHEVGHVANKDTKNAFKEALRTSALRDVLGSAGGTIGMLSDSQLGAIGEALLSKSYSRKQETKADTYGYNFLKARGINPMYMATAFKKLGSISGGSSNALMQAFSDHPDTNKRIRNIEKMGKKDGYKYPTATATKTTGKKNTVKKLNNDSSRNVEKLKSAKKSTKYGK
ncbi:MAG: M48 family metallopeptidase [Bacteroidales bacterium]|nr:M48 family metallopeptidase [Bacteroidales bacterium]